MTWNAPEHKQALEVAIRDAVVTLRDEVNATGADVFLAAVSLLARSTTDRIEIWQVARVSAQQAGIEDARSLFQQMLRLWQREVGEEVTTQAIQTLHVMPVNDAVLGSSDDLSAEESIRELFLAAFKHRDVLGVAYQLGQNVGVESLADLHASYDAMLRSRLLRSICINDSRVSVAASYPERDRATHWQWNDLSTLEVDALAQHALGELRLEPEEQRLFDHYLALDADLASYLGGIASTRNQMKRSATQFQFQPRTTKVTLLPPVARPGEAQSLRLAAQDTERWNGLDFTVPPANIRLRVSVSFLTVYVEWIDPAAGATAVFVRLGDAPPVELRPGAKVRLASLASLRLTADQSPREWAERLEALQLGAAFEAGCD